MCGKAQPLWLVVLACIKNVIWGDGEMAQWLTLAALLEDLVSTSRIHNFASYYCVDRYDQKQLGEEWFHFIWQLTVHYEGKEGRNSIRAGTKRQELKQRAWRRAAYGLAPHNVPSFLFFFIIATFLLSISTLFIHLFIYLSTIFSLWWVATPCRGSSLLTCKTRWILLALW